MISIFLQVALGAFISFLSVGTYWIIGELKGSFDDSMEESEY